MRAFGNLAAALLALLLATGANLAFAAVQATLDRDQVSLGDTLRLTITATDNEDLDDADLGLLNEDFEVLGRSSSSNMSVVNGRLSQSRQLVLDLAPRREGNLRIPSLHIGQTSTPLIPVVVGPAPDPLSSDERVLFEAEVDRHNVYVQGQVILTLRVQQSVNLEGRSLEEFKLDNVFIKPLEQRSFQRTAGGRQWLVHEIRYALFPEKSGTLEIPAQVFSGRIPQPRRSFFDMGQSGQLVRRTTQPLTVEVLPQPDGFSADNWLPVRNLSVEERWSGALENLGVGESVTRTITIRGEGAQGAQLPPIQFTPADGLKYYPDQPQISEEEVSGGLLGIRVDSAALVPTRAGHYRIPGIRIPWWDVQSEQLRYAELPEREFTVAPPDSAQDPSAPAPIPIPGAAPGTATVEAAPASGGGGLFWQVLAAASTMGWLLTLALLWRRSRNIRVAQAVKPDTRESERQAFRLLLSACAGGNPSGVRSALMTWAAALKGSVSPVSLEQVGELFQDEELARELDRLDASLYGPGGSDWNGRALSECLRRLRKARHAGDKQRGAPPLELYPA